MYNAALRACRVNWGTSSATRHLTGQQQSKTMGSSKLSKKKKDARCAHGVCRSPSVSGLLSKFAKQKETVPSPPPLTGRVLCKGGEETTVFSGVNRSWVSKHKTAPDWFPLVCHVFVSCSETLGTVLRQSYGHAIQMWVFSHLLQPTQKKTM